MLRLFLFFFFIIPFLLSCFPPLTWIHSSSLSIKIWAWISEHSGHPAQHGRGRGGGWTAAGRDHGGVWTLWDSAARHHIPGEAERRRRRRNPCQDLCGVCYPIRLVVEVCFVSRLPPIFLLPSPCPFPLSPSTHSQLSTRSLSNAQLVADVCFKLTLVEWVIWFGSTVFYKESLPPGYLNAVIDSILWHLLSQSSF